MKSRKEFKRRLKAIAGEVNVEDEVLGAQRCLAASRLARGEDLTLRRLWKNRAPQECTSGSSFYPSEAAADSPRRFEQHLSPEQLVLPPVYLLRRENKNGESSRN